MAESTGSTHAKVNTRTKKKKIAVDSGIIVTKIGGLSGKRFGANKKTEELDMDQMIKKANE